MIMDKLKPYSDAALSLLRKMISIPSFSKEEKEVADAIEQFLQQNGVQTFRVLNNVFAKNSCFDKSKKTILLNSHHDTVKPASGYTSDPFTPLEQDGKIIGLGSNDAGGCLVSLIATFIYYYNNNTLPFNLVLAATAEEEISGKNGIEMLLKEKAFLDTLEGSEIMGALVGEPTNMQMAVAEKGLLVLDAIAIGKSGHAAREEGINAIQIAMEDIATIQSLVFEKISPLTGKAKATVTSIETPNKAHNVIPAECKFVIDIRINELYSFEEVILLLKNLLKSELNARSFRMRSTMISLDHVIVKAGTALGLHYYGSPTTSDKALMPFPALKIGPGDSARSHTANEYIFTQEIEKGIEGYIDLLDQTAKLF
jgi:acetylornithine deacetylase